MAFRSMLRALCAAAILNAPALPAASADTSPSPSPSAPPEIAHVVTSDRADETLRSTTRTTYIVTHDEIVQRGYRTVGDALFDIPGVEVSRYGPIGSALAYGIRGSSSAQTLVLVNGLPAPGSLANTVELGTLSTAGVRRIEVVEGGGSTLYGTGAIGGIINVITESNTLPGATLRWGTFDDRELRAAGAGFSLERIVSNNAYGLPYSVDPSTGAVNPVGRDNSDYEATTIRYGGSHRLGALGVALSAGIASDRLGTPGYFPFLSSTSREDDVNGDVSLTFALHRPQSTLTLQIGGTRQQIAFACNQNTDPNCFQPLQSLNTESRADLSLRNSVSGAASRLIYGVDLSRGNVRQDDGSGDVTTAALSQTAAYVQENLQTRVGEAYAGLRGENDGVYGGELSPSLGLRSDLSPAWILRLNAATAFRVPNASELYFPGYGNPRLAAEHANLGDVSVEDRNLLGGVTLGWFTNYTRDLIVAEPVSQFVYRPENVDHARLQGFTLDAQTLPYHGITTGVLITDLYAAQNLDTQTRLPNDPVFSLALELGLRGDERSLFEDAGVTVRAIGQRLPLDAAEPFFANAQAYSNVDAYVRFRIALRAVLALRGYNIGNARYAEVTGYPMPGRTFAIELSSR
jgi:vitamin B12 transporter